MYCDAMAEHETLLALEAVIGLDTAVRMSIVSQPIRYKRACYQDS